MHKWHVCFLLICLLHIGCKDKLTSEKNIFYYNESSGLSSLDPAFAKNKQVMWAVHQTYNTLVEIDSQLNIKPSLAKSWIISNNNTTYTFTLRTDVFFNTDPCFKGNRKLVAADVVYAFNRIIDKQVASPGAWIFNNRVHSIAPFTAINDSTFVLQLQKPFNSILGILTMPYCSVVAKEAVNYYGVNFRRHPVGTGPFAFVAWEEGQALILKKNTNYFEVDSTGTRLPYLDGIKVSFYDSKATEFLAFTQGKLDFIDDIDPSFKDEVLTKTGNLKPNWVQKINLKKQPYLNIEYLGILMDTTKYPNNPLHNKKIRQAINYGFDRRKLMLYLRNSIGIPAESGFIPCGLPCFDSTIVKGYNYNPTLAKQLLQQANYKNNQVITLLTVPIYADLAAFIATELQQIGLNIKVEAIQKSLLLEKTAKNDAPFFRGSWIADYPDAENYMSVFYSKNPSPPNYTKYKNPAFDALYEQAVYETNPTIRNALFNKMDKLIIADAPVVPIWYDMAIHLVQKNVYQFSPNSLNLLELRRAKKQ
jgi:oligopeptide transport system substrate-binding protein